jgi:hypothetical protein
MALLHAVKMDIPFTVVKADGSAMNTAEEHSILVTKKIANREMKIYQIFVKFQGHEDVTECRVAARSIEAAFLILQGVGHEAKKMNTDDFKDFYQKARASGKSFASLIRKDRLNGSAAIGLNVDSVHRGSFGNPFFKPIAPIEDYTKEHMEELEKYARLFRERYPLAENFVCGVQNN